MGVLTVKWWFGYFFAVRGGHLIEDTKLQTWRYDIRFKIYIYMCVLVLLVVSGPTFDIRDYEPIHILG